MSLYCGKGFLQTEFSVPEVQIVVTPRSTLAGVVVAFMVLFIGQINLLENYSYLVGPCAKIK